MKPEYKVWIDAYLAKQPQVHGEPYLRGRCTSATLTMQAAFPELIRVAGFANGSEHFWLTTAEGVVVDPTARQFGATITYRAFEPGDEVRVGRYMAFGLWYIEIQKLDLRGDENDTAQKLHDWIWGISGPATGRATLEERQAFAEGILAGLRWAGCLGSAV